VNEFCGSPIAFVGVRGVCVARHILISDSTSGAPACLAGGTGRETVAKCSYPHILGIDVAVFGVTGWIPMTCLGIRDVGAPDGGAAGEEPPVPSPKTVECRVWLGSQTTGHGFRT
jgi:hypothetical protein